MNFEIIEQIAELLKCSICYEILKTPLVSNCQHRFCSACITEWLDKKSSCPICRTYLTNNSMVKDTLSINIINNLTIKCKLKNDEGNICNDIRKYEPLKEPLINLVRASFVRSEYMGYQSQVINLATVFIDFYGGEILILEDKNTVTSNLASLMYYYGSKQDEKLLRFKNYYTKKGKNVAIKEYICLIDKVWKTYEDYCLFLHPGILITYIFKLFVLYLTRIFTY